MKRAERLLKQFQALKECDASTGDIAGAADSVGADNSTTYGTMIQKGLKRKMSKAGKILTSLKLMEAEEQENTSTEDKKVVAQITQNVTAGDIKNASKAAKILADAGKLDKNTADTIQKTLDSVK